MSRIRYSRGATIVPVIAILAFSGCGVKRGDMDAELARIRGEMESGDQALSDRLDRTDREVASMAGLADRIQRLERIAAELEVDRVAGAEERCAEIDALRAGDRSRESAPLVIHLRY